MGGELTFPLCSHIAKELADTIDAGRLCLRHRPLPKRGHRDRNLGLEPAFDTPRTCRLARILGAHGRGQAELQVPGEWGKDKGGDEYGRY